MRSTALIVFTAVLAAAPCLADIRIVEGQRAESSVLGFTTRTENGPDNELWIGPQRASMTEGERTFIIDREAGRLWFVNHDKRSYVEWTLPLDPAGLYENGFAGPSRTSGTVTKTGATRRIVDKACTRYDVVMDYADPGGSRRREITVWATTDVSFDTTIVADLLDNLRRLYNRDDALRERLATIEGVQMGNELCDDGLVFGRCFITEVTSIEEREAPEGAYAPPGGYSRRDRLTHDDF